MGKRLSIIILIIMVAATLATGVVIGYQSSQKDPKEVELITPEDLYLPKDMDTNQLGLFFYDENYQRVSSTDGNVPFDRNKPLVVYIDGQANNLGQDSVKDLYNLEGWQNKGYNTAIFTWESLFTDDLYTAEKKIWSANEGMRFINNSDEPYLQTQDTPKHSVAEIFVAYYYDFLKSHNYKNAEIRWQGHSLGANLAVAAAGYLSELELNTTIDNAFLPSRITMLDGLFTSQPSDAYIAWLDEKVGYEGTITQVYKAIKKAKTLGVAFEYIKSSDMLKMFLQDEQVFANLKKQVCFLEYNGDWIAASGMELEKAKHNISLIWYNAQLDYELPEDWAATGLQQYGISPKIPTSYVYARMGTRYFTLTSGEDIAQDKQMSENAQIPFVAGFAFNDKNGDGDYDGDIKNRIDGIRVELYLITSGEDRLLGSTLTKNKGYFQLPIEPIYITGTNGRDFYVKVADKGDYNISPQGDSFLMNNEIGQNNKSEIFTIYRKSDLKIINIGLTKEP